MPLILDQVPAIVKPADAPLAGRPELIASAFAPADEADDSWLLTDDEADWLAAEAAAYAMYEAGHPAW